MNRESLGLSVSILNVAISSLLLHFDFKSNGGTETRGAGINPITAKPDAAYMLSGVRLATAKRIA